MHVLCEFERHRLVTVPSVTFFRGDRVAINSPGVADGSIALLVVEGLFPRCRAVRLYHLDRLREPVVAIGEELAASLNYYEGVPWKMYGDVPSCFAKEICLEITSESPVRAIREQLSQSTELAQRLLLVSPGFQPRSLRLEDGEETYIVRDLRLASAPNADQFIVQLSPETSMSVAPRITSGVDTVILADCSGSMLVDDLPTEDTSNGGNTDAPAPRLPPAVPKVRGMTRMEKLQRELIDLLRSRLHVPSNGSRMALVGFTSKPFVSFPANEEMREISEESTERDIGDFLNAVANLAPRKNAISKIGKALSHAAKLLDEKGHADNKKLIVLVTDGAETVLEAARTYAATTPRPSPAGSGEDASAEEAVDGVEAVDPGPTATATHRWKKQEEGHAATGRVVAADDDPLMTLQFISESFRNRYGERGFELIITPISSRENYLRWCEQHQIDRPDIGAEPNHELLKCLREESRSGEYASNEPRSLNRLFLDLGNGVATPVKIAPPVLQGFEPNEWNALLRAQERVQRIGLSTAEDQRRDELVQKIDSMVDRCNKLADEKYGSVIFKGGAATRFLFDVASRPVYDKRDYQIFILGLAEGFIENFEKYFQSRSGREIEFDSDLPNDPVRHIRESFGRLKRSGELWQLRNRAAHAPLSESPPSDLVERLMDKSQLDGYEDWSRFQIQILDRLRDFVTQIKKSVEHAAGQPRHRLIYYIG